ncbi:response regulator, partial [Streptococcus pneumoniae]|nr:response regulator [Streptococcus pneumoniae]
VIICDDQKSILDAWKLKLDSSGIKKSIQEFNSCEELENGVDFNEAHTFMVDYDLGQGKMTGIELLRRHQDISERFILVTGHFDEPWLQDECE